LTYVQPGFFALQTFFQKLLQKFGSFVILTVLVMKGETSPAFGDAKGGE